MRGIVWMATVSLSRLQGQLCGSHSLSQLVAAISGTSVFPEKLCLPLESFLPLHPPALSLLLPECPRADFIAVILLTAPQQMGIDLVSAAWLRAEPLAELVKRDFHLKTGERSSSAPCCAAVTELWWCCPGCCRVLSPKPTFCTGFLQAEKW